MEERGRWNRMFCLPLKTGSSSAGPSGAVGWGQPVSVVLETVPEAGPGSCPTASVGTRYPNLCGAF